MIMAFKMPQPQTILTAERESASHTCPVCAAGTRYVFAKEGIPIRACDGCGHRHAEWEPPPDHVNRVYDDEYFFGGGDGYRDYLSGSKILHAHGQRYAKLLRGKIKVGRMMDVGAAAGFVLEGFQSQGWIGAGLEPNASMAAAARERGVDVAHSSLEEYESTAKPFDLVSLIQVIAHVRDLRAALDNVRRLTVPGGYCLIETWDVKSYAARLFGSHWHEYSPPSVLHWFSRASLDHLLKQFGFERVARGRPRKRINGGHAKSLLKHKLSTVRGGAIAAGLLKLIPNRLALPYVADDLFWALYRWSEM